MHILITPTVSKLLHQRKPAVVMQAFFNDKVPIDRRLFPSDAKRVREPSGGGEEDGWQTGDE